MALSRCSLITFVPWVVRRDVCPERLERLAHLRGDEADDDAEHHRDDDRDVEVVGSIARRGGGRRSTVLGTA
jgi:hypothetical protein